MNDKNQQVAQRDNTTAPPARRPDPRGEALMALRNAFETQRDEITKTLPPQIPFERFKRVVDTSVLQNPDLLLCPPRELFNACMKAASDGLLPDGREGALVIYNMKDGKDAGGKDRWRKAVQWMPMIAGILKKVRNSGELSTIVARVVYAGDKFRNWIDNDGEHLEYEAGEQQDRNIIRCAFAMAKLKDGSIEVEVLKAADIEKIRNVSRAKDKGPWVDWWEEMAKKSALRRLSKRLPMSTDLDDIIRRDDALYDLEGARDQRGPAALPTATVQGLGNKLDMIAGATSTIVDRETGEIIDSKTTSQHEDQQHDDETTSQEDATHRQSRDRESVSEGQTEGRKEPSAQERRPDEAKSKPANDQTEREADDSREGAAEDDRHTTDPAGRDDHEPTPEGAQDSQDPTPTAEDRERMEMEAELLSIAQTKAQKGARQLKLWLGSIDDDQLATLKRLEKQIAAYLPTDQKIEWPKRG